MLSQPLFICEACTARRVLGRELTSAPADKRLLHLERMRILDLSNAWAPKTLASYSGKLQCLHEFECRHPGVTMLSSPALARPPAGHSIPLAWAELGCTLQSGPTPERAHVTFNTAQQLGSQFLVRSFWFAVSPQLKLSSWSSSKDLLGWRLGCGGLLILHVLLNELNVMPHATFGS